MNQIIPFLIGAALAGPALAGEGGPDGEAARAHEELRALAEIDGDPETFTREERAKMAVLGQVLGTAPTAPRDRVARAAEVNGGLDAEAPGP